MKHFTTLDLIETIQDKKLLHQTISFVRNRIAPVAMQQIRVKYKTDGSTIIKPYTTYTIAMALRTIERLFREDTGRYRKHHDQWSNMREVFELLKQKQAVKRGVKVWDANLEKRKVLV